MFLQKQDDLHVHSCFHLFICKGCFVMVKFHTDAVVLDNHEMTETKERLWSRDYVFDIGVNFLIYTVHFMLMLWSTSYAIHQWNVSIGTVGLASGIFIVGALFARIPAGRFIDFVGRRRMFLAGTLMFFFMVLLYRVAPTVGAFMVVRFVHGLAFGTSSTASSTVVAALVPLRRMGTGIGYFTLGVTMASAIGPFLALSLVSSGSFDMGIHICTGLTLVIFLLSLSIRTPERSIAPEERESLRSLAPGRFFAKKSLAIALIALMGGVCYSTVLSFLGEYTSSLGLSGGIGGSWFFLFFAATSFLSRPLTGHLLDSRGGSIVIYPALVLLSISMAILAAAGSDMALLTGALLLGAGYGTITAACHALAVHCAPLRQVGVATSTYFVLLDLGIGAGPYLLGSLVPIHGFSIVYECAAVIAVIGILLYYLLLGRRNRFTPERMQQDRAVKLAETKV